MSSESGLIGFSNIFPDAAEWYADLYMPRPFNPDWIVFEDVPPSQNTFEPPPPSPPPPPPPPTGELFPTFPSESLLDAQSVQAVRQNTLPYLPTAPEASSSWPRTSTIAPVNSAGGRYTGATGARLRIASREHLDTTQPAPPSPIRWIKVPQRSYDHGSRQWDFKPLEPIFFSTNGYPGINLGDALHRRFKGLDGRDDPMLQGAPGVISCRLLFPGYPDNGHSCQVHALNWTRTRLPIQRSKLAHAVAKRLAQYLSRMISITPHEPIADRWRIGQGFMHIDNMFLVNLVSVSKGSLQPEIWVADPSASHVRIARR